ncbi:hypothetical protein EXN66_Car006443 [Channa argus]|uniref:Uncharacterized protein n=1 Tax=Channa argus TaxID=215402 RepID=A0A6G1PKE0_CHAAH|nr:hypothetical protein EXN66_Car006443 [Channa argus]
MVDIVFKPLGLVLIATAHMAFNGPSKAEVTGTRDITGILGSNITLIFTFINAVVRPNSYIAVYTHGHKKIAECKICSGKGSFEIDPKNGSVSYHIANLKQNDSETYWASLFGSTPPKESNKVRLYVREEKTSTTVPPMLTNDTIAENNGSSSSYSFHIVTVLVVSPVVLLAALLPWLIWCLLRTKDEQQQSSPRQNSNPTIQETVECNSVPPPSLIYSVLDFPKRPSTVLEINQNDTEYAAVSYLSENLVHS